MTTTVLITGANRGLGQGLLKLFLQKPNHTVIAAVRTPSHPTAQTLPTLPRDPSTHLLIIPYDASLATSAQTAIQQLTTAHGITHLDIVVANAGIAQSYPLVKDVQLPEIREHVETNVLSVVALYQATRDLLQKSTTTDKPVFAIMGSGAGALGRQPPVPSAVYGASKAMVTWYGVRINAEDAWLNAFVLDPGWVQTDMGNAAAQGWGMEAAPTSIEESVGGMVEVLTTGTKERVGGKVVLYTGEVQEW
ncbi:NAD(P)-binding protein [Aspergillus japonicus CBS 114.51]|uniref:NAD(P)-binding protein n=2 Tax=Aspergillus TaxID=5052 RepID=A0A2V5H070_ASPV1|nr:NAD(P)-binding protein [Aspergillus japonicus CBS 114.51]PYI15102.1 NAD(P)-binding protein [Aspergillus violaceofuscus CBS 115571]RAH77149.1 NAD(P)-binding protein [Aspergillus japonicus CBS 114.51]